MTESTLPRNFPPTTLMPVYRPGALPWNEMSKPPSWDGRLTLPEKLMCQSRRVEYMRPIVKDKIVKTIPGPGNDPLSS